MCAVSPSGTSAVNINRLYVFAFVAILRIELQTQTFFKESKWLRKDKDGEIGRGERGGLQLTQKKLCWLVIWQTLVFRNMIVIVHEIYCGCLSVEYISIEPLKVCNCLWKLLFLWTINSRRKLLYPHFRENIISGKWKIYFWAVSFFVYVLWKDCYFKSPMICAPENSTNSEITTVFKMFLHTRL